MLFKDLLGVVYYYRNDGTAGFLSDLEASFVELTKGIVGFVAGPLRIDEDGDSVFYFIDGGKDHLKTLADVLPVQEKTVHEYHPYIE